MKPICMNCKLFYRPKRNGVYFTESMPTGKGFPRPGWRPYKVWVGDLWECKGCHSEIIVGVGEGPVSVQHQPNFHELRLLTEADKINIDDC
jgi:hypothetical protein